MGVVENLSNAYVSALASGITSGAASLTLASATNAPVAPFRLAIQDGPILNPSNPRANHEIVLVGARAGTSCTSVSRGQEGTAPVAHAVGSVVANVLTVEGLVQAAGDLRFPHVGAAIPTGGLSGQLRVADGKLWVNDTGTWKSINLETGPAVYISPTGNDTTGAGTLAAPWRTLAKAYTAVSAGYTIYCRGGTYANTTVLNWTAKAGTSGAPILVRNYPGEVPVFDGNDTEEQSIIFDGTSVAWVVLDGITWQRFAPHENGHMLFVNGCHDMTVRDCVSQDLLTDADVDHHFYVAGSHRITFDGIQCVDGEGWGVHVFTGGGAEADDPKVLRSTFVGCHGAVLFSDVSGSNGEIAFNTITSSCDIGIKFPDWGATGVEVHHNEVNAAIGIHVESETASPISEHDNTLDNATTPFMHSWPGTAKTLSQWQAIDPAWGINDTVL